MSANALVCKPPPSSCAKPLRRALRCGLRPLAFSRSGKQSRQPSRCKARDPVPAVRRASLAALRQLRERRAIPLAVAALRDQETEVEALECIGELGGPEQAVAAADLAMRHPAAEILTRVVRLLTTWSSRPNLAAAQRLNLNRAVAKVQGASGTLLRWQAKGPVRAALTAQILEEVASFESFSLKKGQPAPDWQTMLAAGTESPLRFGSGQRPQGKISWFAFTDIVVPAKTTVQFLAASSTPLRVWLNGRPAYQRARPAGFVLDSDRFSTTLARGANRILVEMTSIKGPVSWHMRFRPVSSQAEHEKLTQAALNRQGDPARGRALFFNVEKSQCLKCHRLGDRGERIGPDLTGVGARFSRVYLIESILEPSRTIAPSYQTVLVVLADGRQLMGVKVAETAKMLTLADKEGKKHELAKADIGDQQAQSQSTMPDGLEKRLTEREFIDLIAFLAGEKRKR